jgi:hypothetical protein
MQSISETQRSGPAIAALALAEREDEVFLTLTVAGQTCSIPHSAGASGSGWRAQSARADRDRD